MNEESATPRSTGPFGNLLKSLSKVSATLIVIAQTRLDLLTTELQDEIQRTADLLVWAFIALYAAGIGLFLTALVLIFAYWETHRVLVSVIVVCVFFAIAIFAALTWRNKLRNRPRMLEGTLAELARDGERLKARL